MSLLHLPGKMSLVARGRGVTTDTASSVYPASGLYDLRQDVPFSFSSLTGALLGARLENNMLRNSGLENWSGSSPDYWTVAGSVSQASAGNSYAGSAAATLAAGVGNSILQVCELFPGETFRVSAACKKAANNNPAYILVRNLTTNEYLNQAGAWVTSPANAIIYTSTSYVLSSIQATISDFATTIFNSCQILIQAYNGSATDACYFDEVTVCPAVNFGSIHAHNVNPGVFVQLRYSDLDSTTTAGTTYATLTRAQGSMFRSRPLQIARYWKLVFNGAQADAQYPAPLYDGRIAPIYIGEWMLGQAIEMSTAQNYNWVVKNKYEQTRSATRAGGQRAVNLTTFPSRALQMSHFFETAARSDEYRDFVWRLGGGGETPGVWVPDSDDPAVCILGRQDSSWDVKRVLSAYSEDDLVIAEEGYPSVYGSYLPQN